MKRVFIFALLFFCLSQISAQDTTSIQKVSNYNPTGSQAWGTKWDSVIVMKNSLITVATVPIVGGRTMEYSLNGVNSMLVSPTYVNTLPTADAAVGGFVTLPSPQSDFSWPPPPSFCVNPFLPTIVQNSSDTCALYLQQSAPDNSTNATLKGLSFKRTLSIYKGSTQVHVAMVLTNLGTATIPHKGIWDITEDACYSTALTNDTMCWAYVPLNPQSKLGNGKHYKYLTQYAGNTDSSENFPNVAGDTNILGIQYKGKTQVLVGADDVAGWIAFVNRRLGYSYVKRFTYVPGASYPDSVSVSVYTNVGGSAANSYFEVEVKGPMATLAPNDSINFAMDLYAARCPGPIAAVNNAGVVSRRLGATPNTARDSVKLTGSYGVFYPGYTKSILVNASGSVLASIDSTIVDPFDSVVVNRTIPMATGATKMYLALYTTSGTLVGDLDSGVISGTSAVIPTPARMALKSGDTRIISHGGSLEIHADISGSYSIEISRLDGKTVASFCGVKPQSFSYKTRGTPAGTLLVRTCSGNSVSVQKVFVGR